MQNISEYIQNRHELDWEIPELYDTSPDSGFTARDIDYLILNFTESQLRHELHIAEVNSYVCKNLVLPLEGSYWEEFSKAVLMAIEIVQSNRPKPALRRKFDANAIKQANDIVVVIEHYTNLKKAGRNFNGSCPLHNDRHPSLFVYPDQQSWHCYQCNQGGDVITFIQYAEKCDFKQAVAILGG